MEEPREQDQDTNTVWLEKQRLRKFAQKSIADKNGIYFSEQLEYANAKELWAYIKANPSLKLERMLFVITQWFYGYADDTLPNTDLAAELTFDKYKTLAEEYEKNVFPKIKELKYGKKINDNVRETYTEKAMSQEILNLLEQQTDDLAAYALRMLLYNETLTYFNPMPNGSSMPIRVPGSELNIVPYVATRPALMLNENDFANLILNDDALREVLAKMQGIFFADFGDSSNFSTAESVMEEYLRKCEKKSESVDLVWRKRQFLRYYYRVFEQKKYQTDFGKGMASVNEIAKDMHKNMAYFATNAVNSRIMEIIGDKKSTVVDEAVVQKAIDQISPQLVKIAVEAGEKASIKAAVKTSLRFTMYAFAQNPDSEREEVFKTSIENADDTTKEVYEELKKEIEEYKAKTAQTKPQVKKKKYGGI